MQEVASALRIPDQADVSGRSNGTSKIMRQPDAYSGSTNRRPPQFHGDKPADRQSESRPLRKGIDFHETSEDLFVPTGGNARSGIGHGKPQQTLRGQAFVRQHDTPGAREFGSVAEQMQQHLLDTLEVGAHHGIGRP